MRLITAAAAGVFLLGFTNGAGASEVTIEVNEKQVNMEEAQGPFIENGVTFVPLRSVFEEMGASVRWDGEARDVHISYEDTRVHAPVGSSSMFVNGSEETLRAPLQIVNDRTVLPVRALAQGIGAQVGWDQASRTVSINMPAAELPSVEGDLIDGERYVLEEDDGIYEVRNLETGEVTAAYIGNGRMSLFSEREEDMLAAGELAVEQGFPLTREDFAAIEKQPRESDWQEISGAVEVTYYAFGPQSTLLWRSL
ncbi:copper amine oxidase N-terminal domain-containing protein [Alkalicoccus chagannorensis]|uniref:copper amine oxidase N-terminal domain-containing protein n=1 Tax=Alkalicoccus chagannorensis TaxID=427072 RepID=UPI000428AC8F|nr:copper amine oxidase N-terminal domain-containing protein [Alkalicoccus chagannorensis]